MNHSIKVGLCFGMTSGAITTLGLLVGLAAGTHSRLAVIGGVIVIAIADACADALGIHVSEESEHSHTTREVWLSTLSAFATKFLCAASFLVPLGLLDLRQAVVASVLWGVVLLSAMSWWLTRGWRAVAEHLVVATAVVAVAHLVGTWVGGWAASDYPSCILG